MPKTEPPTQTMTTNQPEPDSNQLSNSAPASPAQRLYHQYFANPNSNLNQSPSPTQSAPPSAQNLTSPLPDQYYEPQPTELAGDQNNLEPAESTTIDPNLTADQPADYQSDQTNQNNGFQPLDADEQTEQPAQFDQSDQPDSADQTDNLYPDLKLEKSRIAPGMMKPIPETEILIWTAPARPFKPRRKQYFSTILIISLLISLILFFAGQVLPVAVVISIAFLVYVLAVTPPPTITNKITNYGIHVDKTTYYWQELGRFWFNEKLDQTLLNIETVRFPGRITLLLGDQKKEIFELLLSEVLLQEKPELTLYEKAADWLEEKIPLD